MEARNKMSDEDIAKTYVITDTHFFHDRIITDFGFRPSNFNQLIINNWINTVGEDDIVIHLGDVIWGNQDQLKSVMGQLTGNIILVRGNHDKSHSNNWFIQAGFCAVFEKVQMSGVIFSHVPAIMNQEEIDRGLINVFGHFHNNGPDRWEKDYKQRITPNHFLLSLEDVNYSPVSLEKIKRQKYVKNAYNMLKSENKCI